MQHTGRALPPQRILRSHERLERAILPLWVLLLLCTVGQAAAAAGEGGSSAPKPRAWVHIGPPKTGSTTLQGWMMANVDVLARHNITYIGGANYKGACRQAKGVRGRGRRGALCAALDGSHEARAL